MRVVGSPVNAYRALFPHSNKQLLLTFSAFLLERKATSSVVTRDLGLLYNIDSGLSVTDCVPKERPRYVVRLGRSRHTCDAAAWHVCP
jgi:hypothetical protein